MSSVAFTANECVNLSAHECVKVRRESVYFNFVALLVATTLLTIVGAISSTASMIITGGISTFVVSIAVIAYSIYDVSRYENNQI